TRQRLSCQLHFFFIFRSSILYLPVHIDSNRIFFFFNDPATTEIYTLSLHDALPISRDGTGVTEPVVIAWEGESGQERRRGHPALDRKSTRLNSSHLVISYAVFCLKKKKKKNTITIKSVV